MAVSALVPMRDLRSQYRSAELTACVLYDGQKYHNAFSVLRFLTAEVPVDAFAFITKSPQTLGRTNHKLLIARSFLTLSEADIILSSKGAFIDPKAPNRNEVLRPGDWSGPELVGEDEEHPSRACLPYFPGAFWLDELWSDGVLSKNLDARQRQELINELNKHLGTRIERSERIGNFLAMWPERRIRLRPQLSQDGHDLRVESKVDTLPRSELALVVKAMRNGEAIQAIHTTLDDIGNDFRFENDVGAWQAEVFNRQSGTMIYRTGSLFLASIQTSLNLQTTQYNLDINYMGSNEATYDRVTVQGNWGMTQEIEVGRRSLVDRRRKEESVAAKEMLERVGVYIYRGGRDERERAIADIRSLIATHTKEYLKLWDPYFSGPDLARFATAVFDPTTPIRILTDLDCSPTEGISLANSNDTVSISSAVDKGHSPRQRKKKQLIETLLKLREVGMSAISVRVAKCPSHDRFVITQNRSWQLGCSFNQIGNVVSTVVEFPASSLLEAEFDSEWDKAQEDIDLVLL